MFRNSIILIIIGSVLLFIYGLFNLFVDVEDNGCRMTYMFGRPQFSRIKVNQIDKASKYGLYYYNEGNEPKYINDMEFTGAPVIFVPGNGGSMKQVRSLASVALQKSKETNIHLDYFTIDYNEELSGLYGGYLERQRRFLEIVIETVVNLYRSHDRQRKVILIGHSMGGTLCKSVLMNQTIASNINSIILISSPLDKPVINLDINLNNFYKINNRHLSKTRRLVDTSCWDKPFQKSRNLNSLDTDVSPILNKVLIISIGGGNRDLLVRDALTITKFADIHAMTYSIPKVWISCDHLSSVWCLQLMLVINRFLFAITEKPKYNSIHFLDDKCKRLDAALHYFVGSVPSKNQLKLGNLAFSGKFVENTNRIFSKRYAKGVKDIVYEYWDLRRFEKYERLFVELYNYDKQDWLFGCFSNTKLSYNSCEKTINFASNISLIPTGTSLRSKAELDLKALKEQFKGLNYLLVKMPFVNKMIQLNVDFYNPSERYFFNKAPSMVNLKKNLVLNETMQGTIKYKLQFNTSHEKFQSFCVHVEPVACYEDNYIVTIKVSLAWAAGFQRYYTLSNKSKNREIFVQTPVGPPVGYDTHKNPLEVDIYLDPVCRYDISYKLSVASSMSQLIKEFYPWLASHLVCVLIITLRSQVGYFSPKNNLRTLRPFTGFFQYRSVYLITGSRLVKKLLMHIQLFSPELEEGSYIVFIIIHSVAIVISILIAILLWSVMTFNSNLFNKLFRRFLKVSFTLPSLLVSIMSYLPISIGVVGISVALGSASGLALIFATGFYFISISGAFQDHLEEQVWQKVGEIFKKRLPAKPLTDDNKKEESVDQTEADDIISSSTSDETVNCEEYCEGLNSFSYHFTLYILILIMTALHGPSTIVWLKEKGSVVNEFDATLIATVVTLFCLAILLQLKAPNKIAGSSVVKELLYAAAAACVIFCHDKIYYLNFIIASVYCILTIHEVLGYFRVLK